MSLRCHRSKSVWATLGVLALCWLYIFPVYRIPSDKEMVDEVLRQGQTWTRNQTGIDLYRYSKAFWLKVFWRCIHCSSEGHIPCENEHGYYIDKSWLLEYKINKFATKPW